MKTQVTDHSLTKARRSASRSVCARTAIAILLLPASNVAAGPRTGGSIRALSASEENAAAKAPAEVVPAGASSALIPDNDLEAARAAVRADETRRTEVLARSARAVVCVFSDDQRGGGGSGVIIDPEGYGLTNFHVVQPFVESRRGFAGLADGKLYPLKVLGVDPGGDVVMFKLEGRERFDFAPLGDSDTLRVGQWVAAMGNPFMLAEDFSATITLGVISGLRRYQEGRGNLLEYADCIQVSTSINPGNSGGPLFDLEGRVVGINGRASFGDERFRQRVNVGLGYAVSINQIKRFMPGLRAGRLLEHGTLGATVISVGDEPIVSAIQAFSVAERAGVQLRDELLEVAGRRIRTPNDYNNILATLPADWPVTLKLRRAGAPIEIATRLDRLPLGMPLLYVVDLEHNHAELARTLDRSAQRTRTRLGQPFSRVTFNGRFAAAEGPAGAQPITLAVDSAASAEPPAPGDSLDPVLRDEWQNLALPLLVRPEIDLGWELLAGDEIAGRIANVVERRLDSGQRIRWKFDWQTDELLEVAITDKAAAAVWSPASPGEFGQLRWPRKWTRRTDLGEPILIEFESIEPTPVAPDEESPEGSPEEAAP